MSGLYSAQKFSASWLFAVVLLAFGIWLVGQETSASKPPANPYQRLENISKLAPVAIKPQVIGLFLDGQVYAITSLTDDQRGTLLQKLSNAKPDLRKADLGLSEWKASIFAGSIAAITSAAVFWLFGLTLIL